MTAPDGMGYGSVDWTKGAGRIRKLKEEYADAEKRLRKIERAIALAERNLGACRSSQSSPAAEARLIELRRDQAALVDQMRALEREALTL
jgi:hypothetical protein